MFFDTPAAGNIYYKKIVRYSALKYTSKFWKGWCTMMRTKTIALMLVALLISALTGCQSGTLQSPEWTQDIASDISPEPAPSRSTIPSTGPLQEPSKVPLSETSTEPWPAPGLSESPAAQTMAVTVYYLKFGALGYCLVREVHEVHTVPKFEDIALAALDELISGTPTTEEAYRVLPADTEILGVKIENGLATVDFSKEVLYASVGAASEKRLGIDSIVNTLTEFDAIREVAFTVEGSAENVRDLWGYVVLYEEPFSRNLDRVYEPAIWVTAPTAGEGVTSPLKLQGSALAYEARGVRYRLKDEVGNILAEGTARLDIGSYLRGSFDVSISFTPTTAGQGQIEVFDESAMDGSEIHKVIIPVTW